MPLLKIVTNVEISEPERTVLLRKASQATSEMLGKSERYVMVQLERNRTMILGGTDAPLAYLELKSIGLPEDSTSDFSRALCAVIQNQLGIEPSRIYVEFTDAPRHMWGWNGKTF